MLACSTVFILTYRQPQSRILCRQALARCLNGFLVNICKNKVGVPQLRGKEIFEQVLFIPAVKSRAIFHGIDAPECPFKDPKYKLQRGALAVPRSGRLIPRVRAVAVNGGAMAIVRILRYLSTLNPNVSKPSISPLILCILYS